MKLNRNKKIIFLSSAIILVIITMTFFSYAYVMTKTYGNSGVKKTSFKSQLLAITFSDGTEKLTSSSGEYFIPGSNITKTFSITNTGTVSSKYSINLANVSNDFNRTSDLVYELKMNDEVISSGIFPTTDVNLITKLVLNPKETQNFTLSIDYLTSDENQIEDSGKVISANIVLDENIKTFSKLNIYGNTLIEGTPGVTNPAIIKCLGDDSENLFDIQDFYNTYYLYTNQSYRPTFTTFDGNDVLKMYGTINTDGQDIKYMHGKFKENTQYTFSLDIYDVMGTNSNYMGVTSTIVYTDGIEQSIFNGTLSSGRKFDTWQHFSVTSQSEKSIDYIRFSYGTGDAYSYIKNIKIAKGIEETNYSSKVSFNVKVSGKNLFDANKWVEDTNQTHTYISNEYLITKSHSTSKYYPKNIKNNTQYTLTLVAKNNISGKNSIQLRAYYTDGTSGCMTKPCGFELALNTDEERTIIGHSDVGKTLSYISLDYTYNQPLSIKIEGTQLEEGANSTDYEQFQESNEIPINIKNTKNLFDYSNATNEWINNTSPYSRVASSTSRLTNYIEIPNGTVNYTFSVEKISSDFNFLVAYYDSKKNIISNSILNTSTRNYITSSVPSNAKYVVAGFDSISDVKSAQLEEGSVKTSYVPKYVQESLKCVDTVCDYIDLVNKKIVRNIGVLKLDKTMSYYTYTYKSTKGITIAAILPSKMNRNKGISNRSSLIGGFYTPGSMWVGVNNTYFYWIGILSTLNLTTIDEFREWVDANPTYIYYQLSTPIEEKIEVKDLSALQFTNNITACDESLCSSNIEVEYDT